MTENLTATPPTPPPTGDGAPRLRVIGQYVRDLSFENPRGIPPQGEGEPRPQVDVSVNVETRRANDVPNRYEVALKINAAAKRGTETAFLVELDYRGLFEIAGFPNNLLGQVLLVECPRLLFPFARNIAADAVQDGGFPPFLIDPIDFLALYRARVAQEAPKAQETAPPSPPA
ncbi:MAG: protein-export chaperone SecB [Alphaproteobacteria bacterium]|nr:protein-export chaperone SecB [Alphaproteobacteria bacterium]